MIKTLPIIIGLSVALAGLTAYHKVTMWRADKRQEAAVAAMQSLMKTKQEISNKLVEGLHEENITLRTKHDANLKRVRPKACVPVTTAPNGNDDRGRTEFLYGDGITPETLLDFGYRTEQARLKLLTCREYVRELHK